MNQYPNIVREDDKLDVVFSSPDASRPEVKVRCVLDFDQFGEVAGIEILNLKDQAGSRCLDVVEALKEPAAGLRHSYDDEVDAFLSADVRGTISRPKSRRWSLGAQR